MLSLAPVCAEGSTLGFGTICRGTAQSLADGPADLFNRFTQPCTLAEYDMGVYGRYAAFGSGTATYGAVSARAGTETLRAGARPSFYLALAQTGAGFQDAIYVYGESLGLGGYLLVEAELSALSVGSFARVGEGPSVIGASAPQLITGKEFILNQASGFDRFNLTAGVTVRAVTTNLPEAEFPPREAEASLEVTRIQLFDENGEQVSGFRYYTESGATYNLEGGQATPLNQLVPEPSTAWLVSAAGGLLIFLRRGSAVRLRLYGRSGT